MNVTWHPRMGQISAMRAAQFAAPEEETPGNVTAQPQDQMEVSPAGQQAVADAAGGPEFDQVAEKLEANLRGMTKTEFMSMVREQLGEQPELEINWNASVDPDGSIWAKSYIDSLHSQCETARDAIKSYYADAYQEVLSNPLGNSLPDRLNFLTGKYVCSWSEFFDASMPAGERQWTYSQVKAMLTGGRVKLNDPYALSASGLDTQNIDTVARKAAAAAVSEAVRQAKEKAGIPG